MGRGDVLSVEEDIGNLRNFEHEIPMKDLSNFLGRAYRLSPDAREVLRRELQHHKNQGVIQPFMSEYSSPCILVRKEPYKTGPILNAKCRLVVDLRWLNLQCEKTKYCLPHVAETISQLEHRSLQYMSLIDLTKGFSQLSLSPKSYKYVTFRTDGLGSYALKRLPMGYVNASEVFLKAMEDIIPVELKWHVTVYVDDILITTSTFEKHVEVLQKLLNVFSRNGLTIQIDKSLICQKELKFLGFILTREGIKIRPDKCQAIMNMPKPNSPT